MERNRAWPGEHDMVGIRLVKHMMISPRFLSTQATTTGDRRPMLRQHLVALHKELANKRRMPGGPRAGGGMETANIAREQPGIHQDEGCEPLHALQRSAYTLRSTPVL